MLKNYFIVAWRNFRRNKLFSLINIVGLSIGISSALVIFLIVHYDLSFDKFEKDGNRLYRVATTLKFSNDPFTISGVPSPLAEAVRRETTGVEQTIPFHEFNAEATVSIPSGNSKPPELFRRQKNIIFADDQYPAFLSLQWLAGSPQHALTEPYKVVLSEERAKAYFPAQSLENIIGRRIIYNDSITTTVSGIVRLPAANTDFIFQEFISLATIPASGLKYDHNWTEWENISSASQLWLKLSPGSSTKSIEDKLLVLLKKYRKDVNKDDKTTTTFTLQSLSDLHFDTQFNSYGDRTAHMPTLYGLLAVAAFLVLLGCINFINLTTAHASQRSKEIGIRKTMGSSMNQLRFQFLAETFLITLMATVLSILITPLLFKVFSDFIPTDLHVDLLHQPAIPLFLFALLLMVSFLSGFYPAIVLSKYNPVQVLKGQGSSGTTSTRKLWLRKGLTVSQFFIAQAFIMATLVTVKQIHFVLNADLGFKKDAIISFATPFNRSNFFKPDQRRLVLLNELKNLPGIEMVSLAGSAPTYHGWNFRTMTYKDGKKEIVTDVHQKTGDTNYLKLYHLQLLAGRIPVESDTTREFVINENYLHVLGFRKPEEALNKMVNGIPIVGVMADFHQESLHGPIKPLAFSGNLNNSYSFHIALQPQDAEGSSWKSTIAKIEMEYKQIYPEEEFTYEFFDESIAKFYKSEQDISSLLKWAAGLAIFISCLGLLGLVMFTTNLRIKEIGVRKVLGASVTQIVSLLSKDFIVLVVIAFLIATPLAWWAMHKWLDNFAYKTTISWWLFAASGMMMIIIALFTMSIQTIRAANANPVKSLRTE